MLTPEEVALARRLYDANTTVDAICARFNISRRWFQNYRKANGWPMRSPFGLTATRRAAGVAANATRPRKPASERLVPKLEATVERECARFHKALQNGAAKEIDARTVASLVKSLGELKRINRESGAKDQNAANIRKDPPRRSLAELRAELARRLERLAGDRTPE